MLTQTVSYTFDSAKVLVTENPQRTKLMYTFSREENSEFQKTFAGLDGTLLSSWNQLQADIAAKIPSMSEEYDKTPYIHNKKEQKKKISVKNAASQFAAFRLFILDNDWMVSVTDTQDAATRQMKRQYYLLHQEESFLVHEETAMQAELTPADSVIENHKEEWIACFEENISNCILSELQDILEYIDKACVNGKEFGIIAYENGEFRCYTLENDEYVFGDIQTLAKCYATMYQDMESALKKVQEKNHILKMRRIINRCRKHISQNHKYQFMAEMGILRGMMEALDMKPDIKSLQRAMPDELGLASYLDRYDELKKKEEETFGEDADF